ncbi:hypothetical protein NKG94_28535 [Micromonospora sp. M12]
MHARRKSRSDRVPTGRTAGCGDGEPAGAVVAAAIILLEAVWLVAALPNGALVSDVGGMLVAGWATAACAGVARRHPAPLRRFWTLLAVTMALAALGRAIWTAQRLVGGDLPHTPLVGWSSPPASSPVRRHCSALRRRPGRRWGGPVRCWTG